MTFLDFDFNDNSTEFLENNENKTQKSKED